MKKIALVTGGSRGIGRDIAISFAKNKVDVILTYHTSEAEAADVIHEIEQLGQKAVALSFDISRFINLNPFVEQLSETLKEHWSTQSFDYLINNAGIGATVPMQQVTEELFDNLMNIHYKGVYFLTQKCLPLLNDHGVVIFISSGTTRFCVPGYSVYSSLKAAVENLAKYVALEHGDRGIRANIIAPGPVETDFNNAMIRSNPKLKEMLSSRSPLGRVGQAKDIGSVVAFVCSEEAQWLNGQRVEVSGGINL